MANKLIQSILDSLKLTEEDDFDDDFDDDDDDEDYYESDDWSSFASYVRGFIGCRYVYGGASPDGFDCSGFVKYVYSQFGVNLNRIAADQASNGYAVSASAMMPGDIICFANYGGGGYIGHVGIYVGNGNFIHSPRTGYTVRIESLATSGYGNRIACVRRIF